MTGLDTQTDEIIEIATIVTDDNLNVLASPVLAIKVADTVLNGMDDWNTRQHGESGLVDRVRRSTVTLAKLRKQTIAFLSKWVCGQIAHVWKFNLPRQTVLAANA